MILMGHRGAAGEVDENTLPSFEHALSKGIKHLELDIHLSKDGEIVVIHDPTLDRTTDKKGEIKNLTLSEIKEANTKSGFKIPTLAEILTLAKKSGAHLQIEIKAPFLEEKLLSLLKSYNIDQQITIICFDHRPLLKIKSIAPEYKTVGLIFGRVVDTKHLLTSAKLDGLSASIYTVDKELCDEVHSINKIVTVWNANNLDQLNFAKMIGADIIATDFPSKLVSL